MALYKKRWRSGPLPKCTTCEPPIIQMPPNRISPNVDVRYVRYMRYVRPRYCSYNSIFSFPRIPPRFRAAKTVESEFSLKNGRLDPQHSEGPIFVGYYR